MQPIPARLASERSVGATQAPSQFAALYMASGTGPVLTQAESTHLYMAAEGSSGAVVLIGPDTSAGIACARQDSAAAKARLFLIASRPAAGLRCWLGLFLLPGAADDVRAGPSTEAQPGGPPFLLFADAPQFVYHDF